MVLTEQNLKLKVVQFTKFEYTAGQEGTPLYAGDFSNVQEAVPLGTTGIYAGSLSILADVKGVNIGSGTVGSATIPVANEIVVYLYNNSAGTVTEISSGTVMQTINLLVKGW